MIPAPFICLAAHALDGDTLTCATGPHVRLARIDAPELPGHCRSGRSCVTGDPYASRDALAALVEGKALQCVPVSAKPSGGSAFDRWGRIVARCSVNGVDLGGYMLAHGFAVVWPHR